MSIRLLFRRSSGWHSGKEKNPASSVSSVRFLVGSRFVHTGSGAARHRTVRHRASGDRRVPYRAVADPIRTNLYEGAINSAVFFFESMVGARCAVGRCCSSFADCRQPDGWRHTGRYVVGVVACTSVYVCVSVCRFSLFAVCVLPVSTIDIELY